MTSQLTATIVHHSIARARTIQVSSNIHRAKSQASREFNGEFLDYLIVISDATGRTVVTRKVGARRWDA